MFSKKNIAVYIFLLAFVIHADAKPLPLLKVTTNGRFLATSDGKPFFWMGDTGWLLLSKLNREEMADYFKQRKAQGFNVIQVMLLHTLAATDVYGDSALQHKNVSAPATIKGNDFIHPEEYDYWDNVDYAIKEAEANGIYMALVPVWGTNVKEGGVTVEEAKAYAKFLATRYNNNSNIIWMNGGDIEGDNHEDVWNAIGETLKQYDKKHLITFHPRGRNGSYKWFHTAPWLSFNMVQSGHRNYAQDTAASDLKYGEDNWRYINDAYALQPVKPVFDAEPSYEDIPQGLHDITQPRWLAADIRRYAYWSVLAGACGFTYGHNSVMQFRRTGDMNFSYGANKTWQQSMNATGANEMKYVVQLMQSVDFLTGKPVQNIVKNSDDKYERIAALQGRGFALIYTYNGKNIEVDMSLLEGKKSKAYWYDPGSGSKDFISVINNNGVHAFDPPGDKQNGNDWILILEKA